MTCTGPEQSITPLMRQYHAIKAQHPDKILFFRMGDFYEMFGDDAVKAAPILGIALTSRSHGSRRTDSVGGRTLSFGRPISGAAVGPRRESGCRGAGGGSQNGQGAGEAGDRRDSHAGNGHRRGDRLTHCARFAWRRYCQEQNRTMGMALLDLSTGTFLVDEGPLHLVVERLRVMEPSELLYPASVGQDQILQITGVSKQGMALTPLDDWQFDASSARTRIESSVWNVDARRVRHSGSARGDRGGRSGASVFERESSRQTFPRPPAGTVRRCRGDVA